MPSQTTTSVLAGKLKTKTSKTLLENRAKPPVVDAGGDLPPGINDGIAKLVKCGFQLVKEGSANAGKPLFMAEGIIVSPDKAPNGTIVKGKRTRHMEMCFDTTTQAGKTTTQEEHLDRVMNTLKCLGADCSEITSYDQLEGLAAAVEEMGPHFSFRTWAGKATPQYPNPRTNETWGAVVEYTEDPTASAGGVEDSSGVSDDTAPADDAPADEPADETEDLDALAKAADAKKDSPAKEAAGQRLEAIAAEKGLDADEVGNAANWAAVVEMIRAADTQAKDVPTDDEPAADEAYEPAKGDVVKVKVTDPKDKKKSKVVECEIVLVDKKKSAVTLKLIDTGKMLMSVDGKTARLVPFGELVVE